MMRTLSVAIVATLVTGCSGSNQPVNFAGPTAEPAALQCARDQLQTLGYTVTSSDPGPGGSVTAVRIEEQPWLLKLIGFQDTANQITAVASAGEIQVTALSSAPGDPGQGGGSVTGVGANRETEMDAREVFIACAND